MAGFHLPSDLSYNRGAIQDPSAFAKEAGTVSWLFPVGEEFASMPGGVSCKDVLAAAEQDDAPFCASDEIKEWVRSSMESLRGEVSGETPL